MFQNLSVPEASRKTVKYHAILDITFVKNITQHFHNTIVSNHFSHTDSNIIFQNKEAATVIGKTKNMFL